MKEQAGFLRRRWRALIATALLGVILLTFWPREREPEYRGKKLSYWIGLYTSANNPWIYPSSDVQAARTALDEIGTNAHPWLLKCVRYDDPAWRWKLEQRIKKTPWLSKANWAKKFARDHLAIGRITRPDFIALNGFELLGADASAAIPELKSLMHSGASPEIRWKATLSLALIGESSVETLKGSPALKSSDYQTYEDTHRLLKTMAPEALPDELTSKHDSVYKSVYWRREWQMRCSLKTLPSDQRKQLGLSK
jgi:hypothetical protein